MANSPTKYSDVRDDKVIESQSRDRSMIPERQPPNINFEACKVINPTSDKCTISEAGIGKSKLLKFPPEIMVMMLVQYFEFSHSKAPFRVPALVKALRCVPDLYHEALKLYYRRGYFPMRWASRKYIEHLSPTVFKEIRRLSINVSLFDTSKIRTNMLNAMELQLLNVTLIQGRYEKPFEMHKFLDVAQYWLKEFGSVQEFILTFYFRYPFDLESVALEEGVNHAGHKACETFGMLAQKWEQGTKSRVYRRVKYSWKMDDGKPFMWKETPT